MADQQFLGEPISLHPGLTPAHPVQSGAVSSAQADEAAPHASGFTALATPFLGHLSASAQVVQANAPQALLSQCLGRLLALISHELSNPLQSLTMLVELALDEANDPARLQQRLGQGLQAAQELRHVVRDLTDYANASLSEQPQTCAQIIGKALSLVRRRLNRHDVRVTTSFGPLEYIAVPGPMHALAVLHTLLGVVQTLAASKLTAFELTLHGRLGDLPPDLHAHRAAILDFRLAGHQGGHAWVSVPVAVEPLRLSTGEWLVCPVERKDPLHPHVIELRFFAPLNLG